MTAPTVVAALPSGRTFFIKWSMLEDRLDPEYYHPKHYQLFQRIKESGNTIATLRELSTRVVDGPFGSDIKASDYAESGVPFLRVADVTRGEGTIATVDLAFITQDAHKRIARSKVQHGDLVVAKTGATMGAASLIPVGFPEANIRADLAAITLCDPSLSQYLVNYINTGLGRQLFWRLNSGATRGRVVIQNLLKYPVVLPAAEVRNQVDDLMLGARLKKKMMEEEATRLLNGVDNLLLSELGIPRAPETPNTISARIFRRAFSHITGNRFDPHYHRPEFEQLESTLLSSKHARLGEVVSLSHEVWDQRSLFPEDFPYVEIGDVDLVLGRIAVSEHVPIAEAASRARMLVRPGDLLVSLTRPTRRAIAFMPDDLPLAVASTGFAVLRDPNESKIVRRFLFHILRSCLCTAQFDRRSSGGNYPAITENQLLELVIPLPELETQNRLGALLDRQYRLAEELLAGANEEMRIVRREIEALILGEGVRA